MSVDRLRDELRTTLEDVRRRWTRCIRLRACARATVGGAIAIVIAFGIDRVLRPEGLSLVVLMLAGLAFGVAAAVRALRLMPRRPTDRQVARFIEERASLDDSLVSAVEAAARRPEQQPFLLPLIDGALQRLRAIEPSSLLMREEMRRHIVTAAAGSVLLVFALSVSWPSFDRAATTARLKFFPGSVTIQVQPGNVRVPIGTAVRIRASVRGAAHALSGPAPTLMVFANGQQRAVPMVASADAYEYAIQSVDRAFSYDVTAGAARSARYTVTPLHPPRVERIDLHYVYPSFAGLAPRDEKDGGDIYAPAGTRVHLRIQADKPIASGALALTRSPAVALQRSDDCTVEAELLLAKDDSYRIRLADEDGLTSRGEAEYFIRLMDDRPPDVRILRPSAERRSDAVRPGSIAVRPPGLPPAG